MDGYNETISMYHCIRVQFNHAPLREEDRIMVAPTRIICFSDDNGYHTFKHKFGDSSRTVWTTPAYWNNEDLLSLEDRESIPSFLEGDNVDHDVFYIICRDDPSKLSFPHVTGDLSFMDYVECLSKSSIATARILKDSEIKSGGKLSAKSSKGFPFSNVVSHLKNVIFPHVRDLMGEGIIFVPE